MMCTLTAALLVLLQSSLVFAAIVPKKAGLSGYPGIQNIQAFRDLAPYIGWYSDYNPNTPSVGNVQGVPMLWGGSSARCEVSAPRLQTFKNAVTTQTPGLMFGFFEPDCSCPYSSSMSVAASAKDWNTLLAPLSRKGTLLGSPSMCKQKDEDFLTPFSALITAPWNITSIHINKPDLAGVKADVEYYRNKYKRPIFVSEFACVYDQGGFTPCEDQTVVNKFVRDAVTYLSAQSDVVGFGPSNGAGLGRTWPLTTSSGQLSATGKTYLNAVRYL